MQKNKPTAMTETPPAPSTAAADALAEAKARQAKASQAAAKKQQGGMAPEIGGPGGPEPTRYGDWERNGRVSDF